LRHPEAAAHLQPADVLVDRMRGRFTTWTRIRVNLEHVPESLRPSQEPLDPNEDINDWSGVTPPDVSGPGGRRRRPSRARKAS
jgi:bifunctional non-homologous end joining protein LigD